MVKHKTWPTALLALFLLIGLVPCIVSAQYHNVLITPLEQISELSSVSTNGVSDNLFPSRLYKSLAGLHNQREFEPDYGEATRSERRIISQNKGEVGAEKYASDKGWKKLLGSQGRRLRIGPDLVYWDPKSGHVRVIEAKGGRALSDPLIFFVRNRC